MEEILIDLFSCGNDNEYESGERIECLFEDEEYNDRENYDDEFVDDWIELKNRLKNEMIVNKKFNFELVGEDILMWFIEE